MMTKVKLIRRINEHQFDDKSRPCSPAISSNLNAAHEQLISQISILVDNILEYIGVGLDFGTRVFHVTSSPGCNLYIIFMSGRYKWPFIRRSMHIDLNGQINSMRTQSLSMCDERYS